MMINPWVAVSLVGVVGWFLIAKPSRAMVKGKAYEAIFQMSPAIAAATPSELIVKMMPPNAQITLDDQGTGKIRVTFIAPTSAEIGDIDVGPMGKVKLLSFRELA